VDEPGIASVRVELLDSAETFVADTYTVSGRYRFRLQEGGTYTVGEEPNRAPLQPRLPDIILGAKKITSHSGHPSPTIRPANPAHRTYAPEMTAHFQRRFIGIAKR
jgi:hypothetical protein